MVNDKIKLRKHQKNAIKGIENALENGNKCLVKMFCGTGKTRIVFYLMMHHDEDFLVIVFPSISLVTQFNVDYVHNKKWHKLTKQFQYMSICSKNELEIESNQHNVHYTTNEKDITKFIKKKEKRIISVTYQSLKTFVSCLNKTEQKIGLLIYDEAHHVVGSQIQKTVFEDKAFQNKTINTIFLTATPKNENGIRMLDREYDTNFDFEEDSDNSDSESEDELDYYSDCGTLAYEYTHYQAVQDGICNDFDIAIDLYTDNEYKYKSIYAAISRSIFTTNNSKVLTFHNYSEVNHDTKSHVLGFVNKQSQNQFRKEYQLVLKKEFPGKMADYKGKLKIDGLTGKMKNKHTILRDFENDQNNVRVLASCNTISEGIDTKNANQICFVDPRTSYHMIIQNIGRICRKQDKKSTIIIPCYVDAAKYKNAQTPEERDAIIREDMHATGNFNAILNVLSALRYDNPELYDLCLNYPNRYSPKEIKQNLHKYGFQIVDSQGDLQDKICFLAECNKKIIGKLNDIHKISKKLKFTIEVHSNSMETPITIYNGGHDTIRLYHNNETGLYYPIVSRDSDKKEKRKKKTVIGVPQRKKINITVHTNPDVKVLWNITSEFDMQNKVCQAYIESTIKVDNWDERCDQLVVFFEEHERKPLISTGG